MKKLLPISVVITLYLILLFFIIISCKKKPSTGSTVVCPTTAECGCSAKNQTDCEALTDCCKWSAGLGCACK